MTGLVFDPQAAAESWINAELDLLLHPERLARVVAQNAKAPNGLSLSEVFDAICETAERNAEPDAGRKRKSRAPLKNSF